MPSLRNSYRLRNSQRGRGADRDFSIINVSINDESFGDFSEVRHHVRDITLRDVVLCGVVKDFAEQGLTRAAGGR